MQKKTYYINTNKQIEQLKLFLFSVVHFREEFPKHKLEAIEAAAEQSKPDYICIAGDLVNDAKRPGDLNVLLQFLINLSHIAPIVMSLGNHDLLTLGKDKKWIHYFNEGYFTMLYTVSKFQLLDNSNWKDKNIVFTGVTMPSIYYEGKHESLEYLKQYLDTVILPEDSPLYQILFFHSPISLLQLNEKEEHYLNGTDLVLSGHMHGGLTPPFLENQLGKRGLVGPTNLQRRTIFPNYVRGHVKFQNTEATISTGISKLNIPATDLILPPNVNEITISKQKVYTK